MPLPQGVGVGFAHARWQDVEWLVKLANQNVHLPVFGRFGFYRNPLGLGFRFSTVVQLVVP